MYSEVVEPSRTIESSCSSKNAEQLSVYLVLQFLFLGLVCLILCDLALHATHENGKKEWK